MIAKEKESRSEVRGEFEYGVRYKTLTREEFNITGKKAILQVSPISKQLKISRAVSDNISELAKTDEDIVEFLVMMDEKLDRIIFLLSENEDDSENLSRGIGENISASGMNIVLEKPVEKGQIIFANLILSKLPFIRIDVYGEVVRVVRIKEKDIERFQVGVTFINPDPAVKEKIVSCIFRQQRREIQKKLN